MKTTARKDAFTLVELLVVMGIIVLLVGILLPALSRSQETARRVKCAANLRQFGQAMLTYAQSNKGSFPRAYFDKTATTNLILDNKGYGATNPFRVGDPGIGTLPSPPGSATTTGANNVPASIFILIRGTYLTPEVMICPSASNNPEVDKFGSGTDTALQRGNFSNLDFVAGPTNLSYSMNCPFPHIGAMQKGWVWDTSIDPDTPLASDLNPGGADTTVATITYNSDPSDLAKLNSKNHRGLRGGKEGQNVCYADGHVEFQTTPYCGATRTDLGANKFRDNIFTANPDNANTEAGQTANNTSRPYTKEDSVMLPATVNNP